MIDLSFAIDGRIPQTKGSWKIVHRPRPRLVPDNDAEPGWAEAIAWQAKLAMGGRAPTAARVRVVMAFRLPAPPNRRKTNRRDIDKLARSVLDALTKICYLDDEQVDRLAADKVIVHDAKMIGVSIQLQEIGP